MKFNNNNTLRYFSRISLKYNKWRNAFLKHVDFNDPFLNFPYTMFYIKIVFFADLTYKNNPQNN